MTTRRETRVAGAAGILGAVLILGGQYYATKGLPDTDSSAAAWSAWVGTQEGPIETGVYLLALPGLMLFLVMLSGLMTLLPGNRMSTNLVAAGGLAFFVCMATAGVLSSTTASAVGYFDGFEDPQALGTLTGISAGYHLQVVAVWALALAIIGSAIGLHSLGVMSGKCRTAAFVLAGVILGTGLVGFGLLPSLLWMVLASVGLLRHQTESREIEHGGLVVRSDRGES